MRWYKDIYFIYHEEDYQIQIYMILGGGDWNEWYIDTIGM